MVPQTQRIFDILSKGQFISSNSIDADMRMLYNVTEENFEDLNEYFEHIGLQLQKGNEYFYFSRKENKSDLERKVEQAFRWIDVVDFFKTYDAAFSSGFRFTPAAIAEQCKVDVRLKNKLETMRKTTGEGSYQERVKRLVKDLVSDSYAELENELEEAYKVSSSFHYLEQLIMKIQVVQEG